jgi:hypothetical protein
VAKFVIQQRRISDFEAVVEAENEDEAMDMVNEGDVEFDFLQSDDEFLIEEIK